MSDEEQEQFNMKTLKALGFEWIKTDDLIKWLKIVQEKQEDVSIHWIIKAIVKMKNSK